MRKSIIAGLGLALVATAAAAQTPPAQSGPQNSVVNPPNSGPQVAAPVAGHNSFTQGEARSRIEKQGYAHVTGLVKDRNGVWRGKAMKDGQQVAVALDYEGNIVEGTSVQGTTGSAVGGNAGR